MIYGSVCAGIEAATVAWHPLGWKPSFFSEIDKFPRAVLAHHYPDVPLHGDFTTIKGDEYEPIDLLVGGTPCQSFSIAGLRGGLDDDRGNLALQFLKLAQRTRPKWLVWENVPGVLSSNGGRDFGSILGGMVELGYGIAYRILDAQFFGVPQRRRRVFVVGHLGDWRRAAAVLFERESLQGNPPPRRETRQVASAFTPSSFGGYREGVGSLRANGGDFGGGSESLIADTLTATYGEQSGQDMMANGLLQVAHSLRGEGFDASEDGTGRGTPIVPVASREVAGALTANYGKQPDSSDSALGPNLAICAIQERAVSENPDAGPDDKGWRDDGQAYTLEARQAVQAVAFAENSRAEIRLEGGDGARCGALNTGGGKAGQGIPTIAFTAKDYGADAMEDTSPTLRAGGHSKSHQNGGVMPAVAFKIGQGAKAGGIGAQEECAPTLSAVRRLTPRECERLQGFPDNYTKIPYRGKPAADCPDGPRYKALGNSMAVPVMRWIGERIAMVEAL